MTASPSDLFDVAEAQARKESGMARAASARPALLATAISHARRVAAQHGRVTSDDVAFCMAMQGLDYSALGNASGSVFRTDFEWTGEVVSSKRPSTHGRVIRVWRLKPQCADA